LQENKEGIKRKGDDKMNRIPEAETIEELIFITVAMLLGKEGVDFCYYEEDQGWWKLRLYTRIN
jgi:hypothetical protein